MKVKTTSHYYGPIVVLEHCIMDWLPDDIRPGRIAAEGWIVEGKA